MAEKKKAKARVTADRAEQMKKGPKIAGKAKGNLAERKAQNVGVKDGTIRIGRGGKSYNVYDAATGTWRRGVISVQGKPKGAGDKKPASTYKPSNKIDRSKKPQLGGSGAPFRESYFVPRRPPIK